MRKLVIAHIIDKLCYECNNQLTIYEAEELIDDYTEGIDETGKFNSFLGISSPLFDGIITWKCFNKIKPCSMPQEFEVNLTEISSIFFSN